MLKSAAAILIVIAACSLAACGSGDSEETSRTLRIYVSAPMTAGRGGADTARAVDIAVENAGGRIDGAALEVVSLNDAALDGRFDPALVRKNATRAAHDNTAIAYIGETDSGATEISMPILNRAGILQVSSASTAVNLTEPDAAEKKRFRPTGVRTFGRVVPNDHVQAGALVQFMHEESVRHLYEVDDGSTYGTGLRKLVNGLAGKGGVRVVGGETVGYDTKAHALARKVDESGAEAFFFAGSDLPTARRLFRAIHHDDPHVKLFGGDGLAVNGFVSRLGQAELDTYVTAPMLPQGNYARSGEDFLEGFRKEVGRDAEPMSVFGYEAGSIVVDSIRDGTEGDITTEPITDLRIDTRNAFFDTFERASPLGSYTIDVNGDTTLTYYGAYRMENGALVLGRTIDVPPRMLQEVAEQ